MEIQDVEDEKMKNLLKESLLEIIETRRDLFIDLLADAMEDIGMLQAISEVDRATLVSREKIFEYLNNVGAK